MDNKNETVQAIKRYAIKSGYSVVCADEDMSYSFDLILKRNNETMVIKVMNNVGQMTEELSKSIIAVCKFLGAHPLIIGLVNREEKIEDGVVYTRYSLPIISRQTLISYLTEGIEPTVRAGPGGFYVEIDSEKLKRIRAERMLSLGDIASAIGITRRTVLMYESGMSASIEIALKMEELLGEEILDYVSFLWNVESDNLTINFKKMREFERLVKTEMENKGFSIFPLRKSIVNFLAEDKDFSYFGGIEEEPSKIKKKLKYLRELYEISNKAGILIVKKGEETPEDPDIPVISYSELSTAKDKNEFVEMVKERRIG
ncbi:MAG: helix-turn-helix domain-containing protein [Thermoplasmatales archaeon]